MPKHETLEHRLRRLGMDVGSVPKRHKERMKAMRQLKKARSTGDSQYDISEFLKRQTVSTDRYIWVVAGARTAKGRPHYTYTQYDELLAARGGSEHQVFLAHGGPNLIDEQYFFEDPVDAQWFWGDGYKERLFLVDNGREDFGYDRMFLWLEGKKVASRFNEAKVVPAKAVTPSDYGIDNGLEDV